QIGQLTLLAVIAGNVQAGMTPANLVLVAGEQRELTQQAGKDYMYLGQHIFEGRERKALATRLIQMERNQKVLYRNLQDQEVRDLLEYASIQFKEFKGSLEEPYGPETASLVMDNSDVLLEIYDEVVKRIVADTKSRSHKLYDMANFQAVRVARIGKFYLAKKDGITDYNSKKQIAHEVAAFEKAKTALEKNQSNSAYIKDGLNDVDGLWHVVRKFFLDVDKENLPIVVDTSTNKLQQLMDKVAKHYVVAGETVN
ncbi:MAG TPA: hypothetical protein VKA19_06215, partial [Alphaproteobacteria bacterium]|nr:hypothetical protein [Alphaproteobacteria bacterium]